VIAINLVGIRILSQYRNRVNFWSHLQVLTEFFANEIRYTADVPQKILIRFLEQYPHSSWPSHVDFCGDFHQIFGRLIRTSVHDLGITTEQMKIIDGFSMGIGISDVEGQLLHCSNYSQQFRTIRERAEQERQTKGKLYQRLCVLASAGATVMLL